MWLILKIKSCIQKIANRLGYEIHSLSAARELRQRMADLQVQLKEKDTHLNELLHKLWEQQTQSLEVTGGDQTSLASSACLKPSVSAEVADIEFTAHNINLDNGTLTKPDKGYSMELYPWFLSARRILDTVFPGDKSRVRLADLGCLEGGYAIEFARMGFQVLGLEVRDYNIAACRYAKANTNLPNLEFVQDNVWNIAKYGTFDVIFCCGLLYHLDRPKQFLEVLSAVTRKLVILQTHFSTESSSDKFTLSPITENESLQGRWYTEFASDEDFRHREETKWASWDNRQSFWIQREYLLQALQDVGFDLVMEQYDSLGSDIADSMLRGYYQTDSRGTFIGIKTHEVVL